MLLNLLSFFKSNDQVDERIFIRLLTEGLFKQKNTYLSSVFILFFIYFVSYGFVQFFSQILKNNEIERIFLYS